MLSGHATAEGTLRYCERFPRLADSGHFRRIEWAPAAQKLWLSSIGMGTYLGDPSDEMDKGYADAAVAALRGGINVLDTAINYRFQRSERNLGSAICNLVSLGELRREEVLVCTKAGYLTFDGDPPADPEEYFSREYIQTGLIQPGEVASGMHCMAPAFLTNQLERSRANLGLEVIDVFYVHNPETQLGEVSAETFQERLRSAFAALEACVTAGKIRYYGVATWNGFRVQPGQPGYLSLAGMVEIARAAGGEDHHFRFIQLPFNLGMPEAYGRSNQWLVGEPVSLLEAARQLGIAVVGSATLHQGALAEGLPEFIGERLGMAHDWENAIQFSRSAPGIFSALVGMSQAEHVRANLTVAERRLAPLEEWKKLFR